MEDLHMNRNLRGPFVCVVTVVAALVFVSSPGWADPPSKDVNVVNTDANPVPVKVTGADAPLLVEDIDSFATGWFQNEILMVIDQGTVGNSAPIFDVPEGKLGVVEFVSGVTFTPVDSWVRCEVVRMSNGSPLGNGGAHDVLVQKRFRQPRFAGQTGDYSHQFSQAMRFYVEGGRQVGFSCTMIPGPTADNGAIVSLNVSGFLVDAE